MFAFPHIAILQSISEVSKYTVWAEECKSEKMIAFLSKLLLNFRKTLNLYIRKIFKSQKIGQSYDGFILDLSII